MKGMKAAAVPWCSSVVLHLASRLLLAGCLLAWELQLVTPAACQVVGVGTKSQFCSALALRASAGAAPAGARLPVDVLANRVQRRPGASATRGAPKPLLRAIPCRTLLCQRGHASVSMYWCASPCQHSVSPCMASMASIVSTTSSRTSRLRTGGYECRVRWYQRIRAKFHLHHGLSN